MRADAVIIADDEMRVIIDALEDAVQYRWQLAGSCPGDCMSRGQACDECAEHQDAAGRYEHVSGQLMNAIEGPPPRGEKTVKVIGELL